MSFSPLRYLQEGGNIWGECVLSFLLNGKAISSSSSGPSADCDSAVSAFHW